MHALSSSQSLHFAVKIKISFEIGKLLWKGEKGYGCKEGNQAATRGSRGR